MTWVKLDDQYFRHPKSRAIGKDGRALDLAGICYCAGALTDGFISKDAFPLIAAEAEVRPGTVRKLVDAGRWEEVIGGWQIHNYEKRQRTRDEVETEREATLQRVRKHRDKRRGNAVTNGVANGQVAPSEVDTDTETHQQPVPEPPDPHPVDDQSSDDQSSAQKPIDQTEVTVAAVFWRAAEARMAGIANINNDVAYRNRCLTELEAEHGTSLRRIIGTHPTAPVETLADHVLGNPTSLERYRQVDA